MCCNIPLMQCTQTRALIDKCTLITIPSCKYQLSGTSENTKLKWRHFERSQRTKMAKIYMYKICTMALYTSKCYKNHTSCTSPTWQAIINKIFKDVTWHFFSRCCYFLHNSFKCQSWTQIYFLRKYQKVRGLIYTMLRRNCATFDFTINFLNMPTCDSSVHFSVEIYVCEIYKSQAILKLCAAEWFQISTL